MTERQRSYRIAGEDKDGGVWAHETDDEEAALDMFTQLREDLENVTFGEAAPRPRHDPN
jgi:hypothetical protein